MKFAKDILLIDFECTNGNPYLAEPTQLAAILLDKETLEEKDSFESFIYTDLSKGDPVALSVSGITQKDLENAPDQATVANSFINKFGHNVFLASWVEHIDRRMLHKIITSAGLTYMDYDYHYLDLWPIAYFYLLKSGYAGDFHSDEMFKALGMLERGDHDALSDCRIEAEVLRKIIQK